MSDIPIPEHPNNDTGLQPINVVRVSNTLNNMHPTILAGWRTQATDEDGDVLAVHHELLGPDDRVSMPAGSPIPDQAKLPITREALQQMFDAMWSDGWRPSHTNHILQHTPEDDDDTDSVILYAVGSPHSIATLVKECEADVEQLSDGAVRLTTPKAVEESEEYESEFL